MDRRALVGVPEGSARLAVDGVDLAVAREGRGPPVVCLHATGHGGGDFADLARRIGDRFEVIRIDWPGQGRSGTDRQPASAKRYAELLGGALAALGVAAPILVGNSIGGAAAMIHAARAPVTALVLCDPGGLVAVDATARRFCGLFAGLFAAGERGAWWYPLVFALYYRLVLPAPAAAAQRRRIVAGAVKTAGVMRQAWESFGRDDADIRALAAQLTAPVWFAWSKGDAVIPLARCRPAIAAMACAKITEFPGGHAAFLEAPEPFVAGFDAFLQTRNGPAPGG